MLFPRLAIQTNLIFSAMTQLYLIDFQIRLNYFAATFAMLSKNRIQEK